MKPYEREGHPAQKILQEAMDRGEELMMFWEYDKAIEEFQRVLAICPDQAKAHGLLGISLSKKAFNVSAVGARPCRQLLELAERHCEESLKKQSGDISVIITLAGVLRSLHENRKSIGVLKDLLNFSLSPRLLVSARIMLATAYAHEKLYDEAMLQIRELVGFLNRYGEELIWRHLQYWVGNVIYVCVNSGKMEVGLALLQQALAHCPDNAKIAEGVDEASGWLKDV